MAAPLHQRSIQGSSLPFRPNAGRNRCIIAWLRQFHLEEDAMTVIDIERVAVEQDVVIGRGGERDLLADIYRPPSELNKHTAVIHLHGGGFRGGSKVGARTARQLAALGYTCIATQYRLATEAKWPAQIQDVKACIRWVRANTERLDVRPEKVAVLGYSAGGHLALVAGGSPGLPEFEGDGGNPGLGTEVAACVAFYPPAANSKQEGQPDHILLGEDTSDAAYRGISPISYVKPGLPPTMLLHGTADTTIPVEASLKLFEAMRATGVKVEVHIIEGVTHVFDAHAEFAEASAQWIDLFLDRHVVNPREVPSTEPGRPSP
jgi:acetyl esterase/lipase